MSALIHAEGLSKAYTVRETKGGWAKRFFSREVRRVEALCDVSFSIAQGELVGYIGPNGAGKSTTIKILSGILTPDAGACSVLGLTPWEDRKHVVAQLGVVFGQRSQLWWDLPVTDSFQLLRDIYRVPQATYQRTHDELVDRLSLASFLHTPVRQLSLGQRMRCELAAALLHDPKILFLDEPTIGLDAISKLAVREFIRQKNQEHGLTVILTTHDMDDIEAMCSRVLLIGHGRILMDGSVQDLLSERSERIIVATLSRPLGAQALPACVRITQVQGQEWTLRFDPAQIDATALISMLNEQGGIEDFIIKYPAIDEVVAEKYTRLEAGG